MCRFLSRKGRIMKGRGRKGIEVESVWNMKARTRWASESKSTTLKNWRTFEEQKNFQGCFNCLKRGHFHVLISGMLPWWLSLTPPPPHVILISAGTSGKVPNISQPGDRAYILWKPDIRSRPWTQQLLFSDVVNKAGVFIRVVHGRRSFFIYLRMERVVICCMC